MNEYILQSRVDLYLQGLLNERDSGQSLTTLSFLHIHDSYPSRGAGFTNSYVCANDVIRQVYFFVCCPSLNPSLARSQGKPLNIVQIYILSQMYSGKSLITLIIG